MDFERARIRDVSYGNISPTNAFPGWAVSASYIVYDDFSLTGGSISIYDSNPPYYVPSIQGTYFALFQSANYSTALYSISLGQTGQIPSWAQSISFWGVIGGLQITFNEQPLSFSATGSTANYSIYSADISAYAGQTGQLLFTMPPSLSYAELDNIQFSTTPVPEPSAFALAALGGLLFGFRRWRKPA